MELELHSKRKGGAASGEAPAPSWASPLQRKAGPAAVFSAPSCFSGDTSLTTATTDRGAAPACRLSGPPPPRSLTHSTQELEQARVEMTAEGSLPPDRAGVPCRRPSLEPGFLLGLSPLAHLAQAP